MQTVIHVTIVIIASKVWLRTPLNYLLTIVLIIHCNSAVYIDTWCLHMYVAYLDGR